MAIADTFRSLRAPVLGNLSSFDALLERWHAALLACLPGKLRRLAAHREQRLIVVPGETQARVFESQGGKEVAVGELDPRVPGSLQAVLDATQGRRRRVMVRLPEGLVLQRRAMFPAQVRDNPAQVLEYEMDRLSPFRSDQVYFDFRILKDPTPGDKIGIELAICLRDQVQDWLRRLRDRGAPVERVSWEGAWPRANLLPIRERPRRGTRLFGMNMLLLLLVLVLGAMILGTPIRQLQRIRGERTEQLAELRGRTEQVHAVRSALERTRQGSVTVLQRKRELPRIIDLLLELTDRLPDHTWVQMLDYQEGEVQIRGESGQATALIKLLEQAPGITEVAFRSPVQVANSGRERFHIFLRYERPEDL